MKNKIIGYTSGVFDLFHIGHLNILINARRHCDYLIVGVTTDEVTFKMKGRKPIIPFDERIKIVESVKYVDKAIPKTTTDNLVAYDKVKFDVFFKGDDWKGTAKGKELEDLFLPYGVKVMYFPYTANTSSTLLLKVLNKLAT